MIHAIFVVCLELILAWLVLFIHHLMAVFQYSGRLFIRCVLFARNIECVNKICFFCSVNKNGESKTGTWRRKRERERANQRHSRTWKKNQFFVQRFFRLNVCDAFVFTKSKQEQVKCGGCCHFHLHRWKCVYQNEICKRLAFLVLFLFHHSLILAIALVVVLS